MAEYVLIKGKRYPVDTEEQRQAASARLSAAGINSTDVLNLHDGVPTGDILLANTDVDPVENGTKQQDKHGACTELVKGHAMSVLDSSGSDVPSWKLAHTRAWLHPVKGGEKAVKLAIEAYAAYADDYYDSFESELGTDGYFGEHARDMLSAINASLTMGFKSRLDSGSIHRLVCELARLSGVDPEEI